ncbi:MAG: hypothetical protein WCQ59_03715 [Candidatus Cloacimonadaceae bacterium]
MRNIIWIVLIALMLGSCSGEDEIGKDNTPPVKPVLIAHRGDTGDGVFFLDEDTYITLNDENNGIDTVPEGDMIHLTWEPFVDNDLSYLKIYRYSDIEPDPLELAQVPASNRDYLDQNDLVEKHWYYYFIELFDISGNSSISDTVHYAILSKPGLISPENNAYVNLNTPEGLSFVWGLADDSIGFYRVLVWDENNDLLWSNDFDLATEDPPLSLKLPQLNPPIASGSVLRWRVDYFVLDGDKQMYMGSESLERVFTVL